VWSWFYTFCSKVPPTKSQGKFYLEKTRIYPKSDPQELIYFPDRKYKENTIKIKCVMAKGKYLKIFSGIFTEHK
jgi:hypothetical protein